MLYLDSSALIKRYFREKGSDVMNARFDRGGQIYTSTLTYAEVQSAFGRAFRMKEITGARLGELREAFVQDWSFGLSALEVDTRTMIALPKLVEQYSLKASDAVHLSTAYWLRDSLRISSHRSAQADSVEFGVADKTLGQIAIQCGLRVFNPEAEG
jgi:uncharacterized protein